MKTFDECWQFINARGSVITVQERNELEHVFNLMQGCESYLEVGCAEGNSLYVLAHALKPGSEITYIDFDENHTRNARLEVIKLLTDEGYKITAIHGNTMDMRCIQSASIRKYDCVLIDAGHSFSEVLSDATHYTPLATKYVFFHDVCLPEVKDAFGFYQKKTALEASMIINSETFGYGILKK